MRRIIRNSIAFALIIFLLSCNQKIRPDQLILDRIEYIYKLKPQIDKDIWPEFSDHKFDVPLIYYTDSSCYVTNPTDNFIRQYNPELVYKNQSLEIYRTGLPDSIPFHMATGISLGDSSSDYNYKAPYMNCSSPELTAKYVPGVHSTEMWATMLIHEYFHGFQYKHPEFLDFYTQNVNVPADSLSRLYKANAWFRKSIDEENDLLLKALDSGSQTEIRQLLIEYFRKKDQRYKLAKDLLNTDISTIEKVYETMEGTARYVEYSLYLKFGSLPDDVNLAESDTLYHSYHYFKDYLITKDPWLYQTGATPYFYSTGFNIARLLDKLEVDYKAGFFSGKQSLDEILRKQLNTNH